ncbi:MAG: MBL fold metallo-hydrolase [Rubricoccaceae bacterium]
MLFRQFFDPKLAQYAYLVGCQKTKEALVIDPLRDIAQYAAAAAEEGLTITAVAETHIHADFLSGARQFAEDHGAKLYLSDEGAADGWASNWAKEGDYDVTFLRDGDTFRIGNIEVKAIHTPGHTPEHLSFQITDHGGGATEPMGLVTGDFVFVGDLGRPDLLESAAKVENVMRPSAEKLYRSAQGFLGMDEFLQVWPGHGAGSACGKALGAVPQTTVGYEKRFNPMLGAAQQSEDVFVDAILDGQPEPPLYFARMKALNRDGVPVLKGLPQPTALSAEDLKQGLPEGAILVDTRADRSAFMASHLPGALYSPFDRQFNQTVGSLVEDAETPLVLLIDEAHVEEAVRDLVRIGYDRVVHYVTPEAFAAYAQAGGETAMIEEIDFEELEHRRDQEGTAVVDVRRRTEFEAGHVPGAINAAHARLPEYRERIPEGQTLLVHCQSGARAALGAAYLAREGYDVVYVNDAFPRYAEAFEVAEGGEATEVN